MVFHALDIAVNRFLVDPEASQQTSENIMAFNDFAGELSSFGGEDESAIAFVNDESFGIQPSQHRGDTGLRDAQVARDLDRAGVAFGFDQIVNLFEVILHGGGAVLHGGHKTKTWRTG